MTLIGRDVMMYDNKITDLKLTIKELNEEIVRLRGRVKEQDEEIKELQAEIKWG